VSKSVRLSVIILSHAQTVPDIEMYFVFFDRGMFLVLGQIYHPKYRLFVQAFSVVLIDFVTFDACSICRTVDIDVI